MTNKQKKIVFIILLLLSYIAYAIYCEIAHNKIIEHGRYTVATVTDFKVNFRNGYTVYYEYKISNVSYKEKMHISKDYDNIIGYRFFAKFNPNRPKDCFIILDKPALSKFWDAPPNGWEKIPKQ